MGKHPRSKPNLKSAGQAPKPGLHPQPQDSEIRPRGMQRLGGSGWERVRQAIQRLARPTSPN